MIRLFIAFFLISLSCKVFSQNKTSELQPKLLLRFNPLGLGDPLDENLSFGIEHRLHPHWSTGTDAGWVFASVYARNSSRANGVIVRPFIRYYPNENGIGFFEAELHYKYVAYNIEDWLGRNPVNNVPAYEEYTTFTLQKHVAGIHFKAGLLGNISRNERLKFEFTGGLGVRYKWQKVRDGIYTRAQGWAAVNSLDRVIPVVPVTIRLTCVLN
jgi:hypothetical protein